ncbi:MAG: thioredoxin family protein [Gammaproteobacteria bacterium]|nr:thioredoxin family protein [Gammaproteobacteria bacterium]
MKRFFAGLALLLVIAAAPCQPADTQGNPWANIDAQGEARIQLYFFWSTHCPHCIRALPFISGLAQRYPWLELQALEVNADSTHARRYRELAATLGQEANSVPAFLFCGTMTSGFDTAATTGAALEQSLRNCYQLLLTNHLAGWQIYARMQHDAPVHLPVLGDLDLRSLSLPAFTLVLAGLDSFNPCAFFVLLFLLSLLVHARSRGHMLLIGGTFVFFSGLVYFLFMAAWLNLFLVAGEIAWVTTLAGLLAVVIALINIKDFFWLHRGVSLSIPDRARPRLYQRIRGLLYSGRLPVLLLGTVLLALAANSYELLCTAGFPMVYTRILTINELAPSAYYGYLLLYNVIYIIPLLLIVGVFSFTLGTRRLSERSGRLLKLLAGLMMLQMGLVLVLAPSLLNSAGIALLLLCVALLLTWIAARLLPD